MKLLNCFPNITNADLDEFSSRFKIELPQEYQDFLLANNGGTPKHNEFIQDDVPFSLQVFFALCREQNRALDLGARNSVFEGSIPDSLLAFARDGIGNLYCIGIKGNELGKVYFWGYDSDFDPEEDEAKIEDAYLLTSSFSEFLKRFDKI